MERGNTSSDGAQEKLMFMTLVLNVDSTYAAILKEVEAEPNDIRAAVCIGLLARCYKLCKRIMDACAGNDGELAQILLRCLFESTTSFMLVARDETSETAKAFVKSSAQRHRDLRQTIEQLAAGIEHPTTLALTDKMASDIEEDGFKLDSLEKTPTHGLSSWLPGSSYFSIADQVGLKGIHQMSYATESTFMHPNWQNVKRQHLYRNPENGNWRALPVPGGSTRADSEQALCFSLHALETYFMEFKPAQSEQVDRVRGLHKTLHKARVDKWQTELKEGQDG